MEVPSEAKLREIEARLNERAAEKAKQGLAGAANEKNKFRFNFKI